MRYNLIDNIISKSIQKNWDMAKEEWIIELIYIDNSFNTCLCGHYPIKEIITLKNKHTNEEVIIGNCCINHFFTKEYNKMFNALSKRKINEIIIADSFKNHVINERERNFLYDVWRKKRRTIKQQNWYNLLLKRIFNYYLR